MKLPDDDEEREQEEEIRVWAQAAALLWQHKQQNKWKYNRFTKPVVAIKRDRENMVLPSLLLPRVKRKKKYLSGLNIDYHSYRNVQREITNWKRAQTTRTYVYNGEPGG